jgi:hypothetical protein
MRRIEVAIGIALFGFTLFVFLISRVHQVTDSSYSMLLSESLLHHRSLALDSYQIPRLEPKPQIGYVSDGDIYHLEYVDGKIYYFFPAGSSILSIPFVAVMNAWGVSAANPDGTYNRDGETKIQVRLSAILMAAFAVIVFYAARVLLPLGWSALIAMSTALGTQIWSTASRALWSDTWAIFLLGFVIVQLIAPEARKGRPRPVLLACLLAWTYFARPTYSIPIIVITIYLFIYYRSSFWRYALAGGLWLAAFIAYSEYHYGHLAPNYYLASRLSFETFGMALAGNLVSPSRGLLIFVPVLFFVAYLLVRYASELYSRRLVILSLSVIVAHLIVVSGFSPWWAGHSFGPRYTTGLVPWFTLLAIVGVRSRLAWVEKHPGSRRFFRAVELSAGSLLLLGSLVINALGATAHRTWLWNSRPVNVDASPDRVWDWKHPQFLAK